MASRLTTSSDERNDGFGTPGNLAHHKPGIQHTDQDHGSDDPANHRLKRSDTKDIPQRSLTDRIAQATKGGSR